MILWGGYRQGQGWRVSRCHVVSRATPQCLFKGLISCSLLPRTSPGSAVVLPVVVAQPFSVSSTLCAFQERSRLFQSSSPGSLTSLGHPVCDCRRASPAKKSSKGHAFAVRQPPDPTLIFPSSIFFTNFFTTLPHLSRQFSLSCLCATLSECTNHCQSLKPLVDQP